MKSQHGRFSNVSANILLFQCRHKLPKTRHRWSPSIDIKGVIGQSSGVEAQARKWSCLDSIHHGWGLFRSRRCQA